MRKCAVVLFLVFVLWGCDGDGADQNDDTMVTDTRDATNGGDWGRCEYVGDCVLQPVGCCDTCNRPTAADRHSVNINMLEAHRAEVCQEENPICPGCDPLPNPWLQPTCQLSECAVVDIENSALTTCTADADCTLRVPECCECGANTDPANLIALAGNVPNVLSSYLTQVCDPRADCAACAPIYPDTHEAFCDAGSCGVREKP